MLEEQTLDALAARANGVARRHHGVDGRLGQGLGAGDQGPSALSPAICHQPPRLRPRHRARHEPQHQWVRREGAHGTQPPAARRQPPAARTLAASGLAELRQTCRHPPPCRHALVLAPPPGTRARSLVLCRWTCHNYTITYLRRPRCPS
jgi:hypothetical protein